MNIFELIEQSDRVMVNLDGNFQDCELGLVDSVDENDEDTTTEGLALTDHQFTVAELEGFIPSNPMGNRTLWYKNRGLLTDGIVYLTFYDITQN